MCTCAYTSPVLPACLSQEILSFCLNYLELGFHHLFPKQYLLEHSVLLHSSQLTSSYRQEKQQGAQQALGWGRGVAPFICKSHFRLPGTSQGLSLPVLGWKGPQAEG